MKRILIADDHAIVRLGVRRMLSEYNDFRVDEAATAEATITALRAAPYDLVILDLSLGPVSGLDVLKQIKREFPAVPVLMLSMHSEDQYAIRCLKAGASGYLTKHEAPEDAMRAVMRVLSGRRYVSEDLAEQLATDALHVGGREPHQRLSDREFQVFLSLASGRSVTEIGRSLHLSVKTVSTHRSHILQKMGLQTNADLVRYAIEHNIHLP
jgi:two-component system invasion response regulator UvrY